jgi:hypothetical protein
MHLAQLLQRVDGGGAVLTLSVRYQNLIIIDQYRKCNPCLTVPVSLIAGRTVTHNVDVTYGPTGSISWIVKDTITDAQYLNYTASGWMGDAASLKFGTYRASYAGMPALTNHVG